MTVLILVGREIFSGLLVSSGLHGFCHNLPTDSARELIETRAQRIRFFGLILMFFIARN